MNLRQKVKQAKKELTELQTEQVGSTTWEIIQRHYKEMKLQKIIDTKKKPNRFYHYNEDATIGAENFTYLKLLAGDNRVLAKKVSVNGKPFSESELQDFLLVCQKKIGDYGKRVYERKKSEENKVTYELYASGDRTKRKRVKSKGLYYQFDGSDLLHHYPD